MTILMNLSEFAKSMSTPSDARLLVAEIVDEHEAVEASGGALVDSMIAALANRNLDTGDLVRALRLLTEKLP